MTQRDLFGLAPAAPAAAGGAPSEALPPGLEALAEAVGLTDALLLARSYGGVEVYLAERPRGNNPVVRAIGEAGAARLVARLGAGWFLVPMLPQAWSVKRQLIRRLLAAGETQETVARAVQVHQRTIRRHAAALRRGAEIA